jgi:hypothetical protein
VISARSWARALPLAALMGCGGSNPPPLADASTTDATDAADESDERGDTSEVAESVDVSEAGQDTAPDAIADATDGGADADAAVEIPAPPEPYARPTYQHLSETGLFEDFAALRVAADVIAFEPTYKLWSDAATKRRWLRLPPGTQIDTTDMDHWVFPVGTKLWKEFSLDGQMLETRLIERYGTGSEDYWMGAFVWNASHTDAVLAVDGQQDINGTMHDAPAQKDCGACHRGDVGRVLGFSAIQLSRTVNPPALPELATMGLLSHAPAAVGGYPLPGDAVTSTALGYLHANCGHCHNKNGTAWPDTQMVLRSKVNDTDVASSGVYTSIVGQPLQYWRGGAITLRVAPGAPAMSALIARMKSRTPKEQMPPLATELVDPTGIDAVSAWISALPP